MECIACVGHKLVAIPDKFSLLTVFSLVLQILLQVVYTFKIVNIFMLEVCKEQASRT